MVPFQGGNALLHLGVLNQFKELIHKGTRESMKDAIDRKCPTEVQQTLVMNVKDTQEVKSVGSTFILK